MNRGAILFHPNFEFYDGGKADKLLVVMNNAGTGDPLLLAKTTSQQWRRSKKPGCELFEPNFFIPKGRGFFRLDTWIVLDRLYPVTLFDMTKKIFAKEIERKNDIPEQEMNAIRNCALRSDDLTIAWAKLLKK